MPHFPQALHKPPRPSKPMPAITTYPLYSLNSPTNSRLLLLTGLLGLLSLDPFGPICLEKEALKIRKVKCDETKPSCHRCKSTGRKCEGYLQQKQTPSGLLEINPNRIFQDITTQGFGRALEHYSHVVGPALSGAQDQYFWTSLVLQFANFEPAVRHSVAAISLLYEHLDPIHYLSQLSGPSDYSFKSLSDARYLIDEIFGQALRLYCLGDEYRIGRFRHCLVPEGLLRDQSAVNSLLDSWYSMFSILADQLSTPLAASTASGPNLLMSKEFLLARSYVCRIAANMALEKEETAYDQYLELFQQVCQNLDLIAAYVVASAPTGGPTDTGRTKFTFEMGFMPTICFCIMKCRHLETRLRFWRLLPILSKSQESLWQLNSMIIADQRLIELEHGIHLDSMREDMSLYSSELPPDESRIRRMWVAPMPTHRIINGQHLVGRMVGFTKVNRNRDPIYGTEFVAVRTLQ
ncbi:hypothetical protein FSARC_13251 [Fusarium sarcochroum]|uniref:Zn(2)-C6 fungal-type domain-containing protein n=1 Tax=Fusarium sarcochroum TaxID=1208366 RepID=A0A8H4T2V7_9HYPO|nr:hypothetical protein FSARC_13251 [Fusarium sarcochroum]